MNINISWFVVWWCRANRSRDSLWCRRRKSWSNRSRICRTILTTCPSILSNATLMPLKRMSKRPSPSSLSSRSKSTTPAPSKSSSKPKSTPSTSSETAIKNAFSIASSSSKWAGNRKNTQKTGPLSDISPNSSKDPEKITIRIRPKNKLKLKAKRKLPGKKARLKPWQNQQKLRSK